MKTHYFYVISIIILPVLIVSCLKKPQLFKENDEDQNEPDNFSTYIYPYSQEPQQLTAEITVKATSISDLKYVQVEIPPLKYNKSTLILLSQDDCGHSAYSCTWAAIHGRPLNDKYFYDVRQLEAGDLPPDCFNFGTTLGSTDGAGNEVRFAFTTTLAPEEEWMNAISAVETNNQQNYYRFYMKSGLIWDNVIEMANFGTGIAFHDVQTPDVNNADSILAHYAISQEIIKQKLSGRNCKMLAEPNGNKTYVKAARQYAPIQFMTAQAETETLYPFQATNDLQGKLINRIFYNTTNDIKKAVTTAMQMKKEERPALFIGIHRTYSEFARFLLWLNDTYGQAGEDAVWIPNAEEYYEYNYYRVHSNITQVVQGDSIKLNIPLSGKENFYYPSITINLKGLKIKDVSSVTSNDVVKGLSYANYGEGLMVNIDCRQFLVEHATHFVEKYEKNKSLRNQKDASYFVNSLKDSDIKRQLLKRIK